MTINKILTWVNNKQVRDFDGFTLQIGFYFGFIHVPHAEIPFVWNGTYRNGGSYIIAYMGKMDGTWEAVKITQDADKVLFDGITSRALKNNVRKQYASALQLEDMRIAALRSNGYETALFSANPVTSRRKAKPHTKQLKDAEREYFRQA